ncbi:MAG TPA: hypothetical protein VMR52_04120 [Dehalococcoidia bacterium]|nr:hypothetical protein [Dehalococcoidia bacterium]
MRYAPRTLTVLSALLLAALAMAACGGDGGESHACSGLDDGLHGTTLCQKGTGESAVGSFVVAGTYDVQVIGGNVGASNTTIRVYQLEEIGNALNAKLVGTTGPKAVVQGIQVRPGDDVNVNFDFGPGEFYLVVESDPNANWTAIVSPVDSVPG